MCLIIPADDQPPSASIQ